MKAKLKSKRKFCLVIISIFAAVFVTTLLFNVKREKIVGTMDESFSIILSSGLEEDVYTLKYETSGGTQHVTYFYWIGICILQFPV